MNIESTYTIKFERSHSTESHRTELSLLADEVEKLYSSDEVKKKMILDRLNKSEVTLNQEDIDILYGLLHHTPEMNPRETPVLFEVYMMIMKVQTYKA